MKKLILALMLALAGCSSAPRMPKPGQTVRIPVTAARWQPLFLSAYATTSASPFEPDDTADELYFLPSHAQLARMDKWVRPRQHRVYIPEANDCDDIAWEWKVLTHRWAVEKLTGRAPLSIATFVAYVEIYEGAFDGRWSGEGLHALGLLCDDHGVWWYHEPSWGWHVKVEEAKFEGTIRCVKILW